MREALEEQVISIMDKKDDRTRLDRRKPIFERSEFFAERGLAARMLEHP